MESYKRENQLGSESLIPSLLLILDQDMICLILILEDYLTFALFRPLFGTPVEAFP